ncbi:alpha/beta hydrolase family protein [Actinomycetospora cinnamomea]|uniref:Alpha/beta hydrolase family protein n=1 Tax=Actinomycetospora cinnamomea TaxID=663609 RepID=A0A2U1FIK2_9PSEU|nr:alpha/beta hydrolase [Actinomycetospora cinnamomea]PVZ12013.1 alpha/beta hydrolase family protein [Actinomycetospora cinnamomea]
MCAERLAYGPGAHQFVDVTPGRRRGTVVLLHGGFWRARVGLDHIAPVAEDLHARGPTVWNVEYRRVGQAAFPATLDDVEAAVGRAVAAADPPVVVVGHSAGGHLAAWVAARVPVAGIVSLAGVLTLADAARDGVGGTAVPDLVGGMPDEVPERYAAADPMALLPIGVPVRCVHAPGDDRVPPAISRRYVAAARASGDDATLIEVPGDHFTIVDPAHETWPTVLAPITDLLDH